ncbi:MCE family protein [Nocardioides perillae]|uniref:Phospholipid/cholesterol/gamma-HCH transport system substrate-binding protein n=1 Tax=Nocardioides perillae TaxID=1119534 RepID=A0A7Y9RR60_9ACTN|nr:MCE family protein [Nocardioides perillae]NYG53701.1 phospholipid/cholesterol/gamma-HCH transport system substrate-binding protein [Nocardioides perillae]
MRPFRERNPVIIGLVSIVVLVGLLAAAFRADDLPLIGGGDTYYAAFSEAGGLKVNDEVRLAGVRVGTVQGIELEEGEVKVEFRVEEPADLGTETGAAIKVKTLLGDMFLAVEPRGEGRLEEGTEIPVERTSSPYDVVQAFEGLADTAGRIDTDQLAASLTTLADLGRNSPEEFRGALSGLSRLSQNLAAKDDQIGSLLESLTDVSRVLDERDQDIIGLMEDADVLFRALVERREVVRRLLVSTTRMSTELTALVRQSRADLKPALQELEGVVQLLLKNEDNLDDSLRLMAPFYRVFANTLGTGPWFDTFIQNFPASVPQAGG